jgi:ABC-type glutathione transport system ATPase component
VSALLELEHLRVRLPAQEGTVAVLRDVSLQVAEGEAVGLVGASGSGKTMTARAVVRLLPPGAAVDGTIRFRGRSVLDLNRDELLRYRSGEVAMIFQDPRTHINPVRRLGDFLTEALVLTQGRPRAQATAKVTRLLGETGVDEPERRLRQYPHELSGGQLQRVMIAAALACEPKLLIADEPTTALDVTTQSEVMAMLDEVRRAHGLALLFITHDLDLAAAVCERTVVMREGAIVSERPVTRGDLLRRPLQAVTGALGALRGDEEKAKASSAPAVLEVRGLRKVFSGEFLAVQDISFTVPPGGSLAIVGESGSGKTTIARMIVGLQEPSAARAGVRRRSSFRTTTRRWIRASAWVLRWRRCSTCISPPRRTSVGGGWPSCSIAWD